jgi:nucleotide-binding universal stress UspA family protein
MFSHILVCSDGSEPALKAAQTAAEIAQKFNARVTLLNVYIPPADILYAAAPSRKVHYQLDVKARDRAHTEVERRTGKVFESAGVRYACRRGTGQAVEHIVRAAEKENADLIVLGSRGMGIFQRFMLGSVSDGVLHHAPCPVLIVR